MPAMTGAEDFFILCTEGAGLFFFLGGKPLEIETLDASQHHTPDFYLDESGFSVRSKVIYPISIRHEVGNYVGQTKWRHWKV